MLSKEGTIIDRREMLRVKLKSLSEEARLIRREEKRTSGQLYRELRDHRIGIVRSESRHTHIAYALIRGRTYEQIENKAEHAPDWDRIRKMIDKYGPENFSYPQEFKKAA